MQTHRPSADKANPPAGMATRAAAPRCCMLTVWSTGDAGFAARAVLMDGTLHDFTSPFELARFLSSPLAAPVSPTSTQPGLR